MERSALWGMQNTEGRVARRKEVGVPRFFSKVAAVAAAMKGGKEGARKEEADSGALSE